jgi:pilus assembly protein CpaB
MQMQRQRIIMLGAGILLAAVTVILVRNYLEQERQTIVAEAKRRITANQENRPSMAPVLLAKSDIPAGSEINLENIELKTVPVDMIPPQAITSLEKISGMSTIASIAKGEPLSLNKLSIQQIKSPSLAMVTPVGKRAVSVGVENIGSLINMIKPGDYVDVISIVPVPAEIGQKKDTLVSPLFQNILVLAVGRETSAAAFKAAEGKQKKEKAEESLLITLALTPEEANLVAFVQEQGKIRLNLRSQADSQIIESSAPTSWDTLLERVRPKKEGPPAVGEVQIYRGTKKEEVPLYNK